MTARILGPQDALSIEAFLVRHRDSSMFLRGNLARGGVIDRGEMYQGTYAGYFVDGELRGVAGHFWNGHVLVQAPEGAGAAAIACVAKTGRRVLGSSGPLAHVREALTALGMGETPPLVDGAEDLYVLDTKDLVEPRLAPGVAARAPRPDEYGLLYEWRLAYDRETFDAKDTPAQRVRSKQFLDAQLEQGNAWVATVDDAPVSLGAFNAALPDIVQLGGIYTPPALRGKGYARVACSAALRIGRSRGADRAVLFTRNPSAVKSYESLGFRRAGEFGLMLFG